MSMCVELLAIFVEFSLQCTDVEKCELSGIAIIPGRMDIIRISNRSLEASAGDHGGEAMERHAVLYVERCLAFLSGEHWQFSQI